MAQGTLNDWFRGAWVSRFRGPAPAVPSLVCRIFKQGFTAMSTSPQCGAAARLDLKDVIEQHELDAIALRRSRAGFSSDTQSAQRMPQDATPALSPDADGPDGERDRIRRELVGLAFSGGGVRSASFNLGLTQALDEHGVLRHVDYLSSVSGGSYVGGMLTNLYDQTHKSERNDTAGPPDIGLRPRPGEGQPALVRRLVLGGNYLLRPALFANQYAIGMLLNLLPRLSLLVAVGAGLAYLWRCLDSYGIRDDYLKALGLRSDFAPALLPAVVVAAAWALAWVLSLCLKSQPLRRASQYLFIAAIVCLLVGGTVLVGNGDVTAERADGTQFQTTWFHTFRWPIAILTVVGLLPVVLPRSLLRSGTSPKRWLDSWVFYYTSFVLLVGVPLLVVGMFAREGISGYAKSRGPEFDRGDIKDMELFCAWLAEPACRPGVSVKVDKAKLRSLAVVREAAERLQEAERVMAGRTGWSPTLYAAEPPASLPEDRHWWMWRYLRPFKPWMELTRAMIPGGDNGWIAKHAQRSRQAREYQNHLLWEFNQLVLADAAAFRSLAEDAQAILQGGPWAEKMAAAGAMTEKETIAKLRERLAREPLASLVLASHSGPAGTAATKDGAVELQLRRVREQRLERNRLLLEAYLPQLFRSRAEIRRVSVIEYDQRHRLLWTLGALAVFVLSALVIGPNLTSQHAFYRERLAKTFLSEGDDREPEQRPPLESHQPQLAGGPYPLFGGAVSCGCASRHPEQLEAPFERFLMSPKFCGSATLGYFPTSCLDLTLADTVAISGAALTPNYFVHHFVTLIMALLNLRLGKWLRNPNRVPARGRSPSLLQAMYGDNFQVLSARRYVLVTDGGHVENLGLGDLLDRRCRLIIVSDAGSDEKMQYTDFCRVLRRYRREQGIEFLELDGDRALQTHGRLPCRKRKKADEPDDIGPPKELCREPSPPERRHFFCGRILYPQAAGHDPEWGLLVYIKPCLTGDEDADVCNYAFDHDAFPHESTADQTFSDIQFEAYRVLGYHTGQELCAALQRQPGAPGLSSTPRFDLAALLRGFTRGQPASEQTVRLVLAATAHGPTSQADRAGAGSGASEPAASEPAIPRSPEPPVGSPQTPEQALHMALDRFVRQQFDASQRLDSALLAAARQTKEEIFLQLLVFHGDAHPDISDQLARLLAELDDTHDAPFISAVLVTLRRLGVSSPVVLNAVKEKRGSRVSGIAAAAKTALRELQPGAASRSTPPLPGEDGGTPPSRGTAVSPPGPG